MRLWGAAAAVLPLPRWEKAGARVNNVCCYMLGKVVMRVKRTLAISAILIVALAGLGFVGLQVWLWYLGIDEPPPDDSDLRPAGRMEVPVSENAYPLFVRAGRMVTDVSEVALPDLTLKRRDATRGADGGPTAIFILWDVQLQGPVAPADVRAMLDPCEEALALFDKGLQRGCLRFPPSNPQDVVDLPSLWPFVGLAKVVQVEAQYHAAIGETDRAVRRAVDLAQYGHLIEARGGEMQWLSGSTIKVSFGLSLLRTVLSHPEVSAAALADVAERLDGTWDSRDSLVHALKQVYRYQSRIIQGLCSGEIDPKTLKPRKSGPSIVGWRYRPNQTRRWLAERIRTLIGNVHKPLADFEKTEPLVDIESSPSWLPLKGNVMGRLMIGLIMPSLKGTLEVKCQRVTEAGAIRAVLAMRRFQLDNGRLPTDPNELVPDYLDAVPRDDFDGKPLRYNREKRIIYSVGKDLKDDGGMTQDEIDAWWKEESPWEAEEGYEPPFWDLPDPSWPIEF